MSTRCLWVAGITLGLAIIAPNAYAQAAKAPAKAPAKTSAKATVKEKAAPAPTRAPALTPAGLKFGMTRKEVTRLYTRAIEGDYKQQLKDAQPGVEQTRLRETIDNKKNEFRLSYVSFDGKPAALDDSPYKKEYAHETGEGVMTASRLGKTTMLFFMKNKLWKVIDVYKLSPSSKWGADYNEGSQKLGKRLGAAGKRAPANAAQGRENEEVEWYFENMVLRAIKVGKTKMAIAYVDKDTQGNLANLRPKREKKQVVDEDVDPSVKAVMRDTSTDPRVNPDADPSGKSGKSGKTAKTASAKQKQPAPAKP
ncbi:MAG TPA: hypothetical protein VFB62_19920 [Polyangiaceae bacterium]|jgi:hypothetical protein|nr:hypothetical protein [Polyangiaceae bacterium]